MTQSADRGGGAPAGAPLERHLLGQLRSVGSAGALALVGAGAAVAEVRHRRLLSADADFEQLRAPLHGTAAWPVSADGTVLHAEIFGPDTAPTFVLAPGWTETLTLFDQMTRLLVRHGFRVVAYDLRGQGESAQAAAADYRLARYGDDVEAVVTQTCAGRDDVIVVGHSLGAMSVAAWAADHEAGTRVRAAALVNTGLDGLIRATKLLPTVLPESVARPLARYAFLGNPLPFPALSTVVGRAAVRYVAFGPGASAAHVTLLEHMLMTCPPAVRRASGLSMSDMDLLDALSRLTVPTLVVAGADDRLTPPTHSERIAARLPACSEVLVLSGVGHMTPLEAPAQCVDALVALADSVPAGLRAVA